MSISYKTPSYFSSFSCLGSDCEDTCCRNWDVKLDRKHYELLSDAMLNDRQEKSMFDQYIRLNEDSISGDHDYAFIRMGVSGYCAMLDDKGLCSIHVKYGVEPLGNVCSMFPRVISRCGDVMEMSGALSCPEVVRGCIDDTQPLKLKRFKPADLPRSKNYPIQREISLLDEDYYLEKFEFVRGAMMHVMANETFGFETRLYATVNLVNKISPFYHRGCRKSDTHQLETMVNSLSEDNFISKVDLVTKDFEPDLSISMIVVHSVLSIKLQQSHDENISQLYQKIITDLNVKSEDVAGVLASTINDVSNKIDSDSLEYIDKALTRYILNCIYREWFVSMPDSFTYFHMLLVRIALLRSLIYLDVVSNKNIGQSELKERIVYIMYNFARDIDQNLEFLKVIYNALSEQNMMNFDFSPSFIRFY